MRISIDGDTVFGSLFCTGVALATVLSWDITRSIGWTIVHGFFNWFYVLYIWLNYYN